MYILKNSIQTFLSKTVNHKNEYIDIKEKKNEKLIRQTFNYLFKTNILDDYWTMLWNMIQDPSEVLGLIGIDSLRSDKKQSYGLVFNLGIPKLRSRRIHYMPRIYAHICLDSDSFVWYSNSPYDIKKEDSMFRFGEMNNAYHPHISAGKACLGSFSNDLEKARHTGNPILFLHVLRAFVNSWNAKSPFFSINSQQQDYVIHREDGPNKKYKEHHINQIWRTNESTDEDRNYNKFKKFVHKYISIIESGSVQSDIKWIYKLYLLHENNLSLVRNSIKTLIGEDIEDYLFNLSYEIHNRREDNPRTFSSHHSPIPVNTVLLIPYELKTGKYKSTRIKVKRLRSGHDYQHTKMLPMYRYKNELLNNIAYWLDNIRSTYNNQHMMATELMQESEISIDYLFFDYIANSRLTNSSLLKRESRVRKLMKAKIEKTLNKDVVINKIDNNVKEAFQFELYEKTEWNGDKTTSIDQSNSGSFWKSSRYRAYNDEMIEVIKLLHPMPQSLDTAIETYERIKKSLIQEDIKHLINNHEKHIGELKDYGYKINNTSKDTQQVHLSFEEI